MMRGKCVGLVVPFAVAVVATMAIVAASASHDYGEALSKCILFFEGQRSGKLPKSQRMTWRDDSALHDGADVGVDLVGGYYDAGDNVKFNFPMAFSTTMLAWGLLDFGQFMGSDRRHAEEAVRWATDYLLKATSVPGRVFVQVGDAYSDHNCWERPEDMDTLRTAYAVTSKNPGSEVSAEIAAALAASAMVYKASDPGYAATLRNRAIRVFEFADNYRGSYNDSLGLWVCPFYCDFSGYQDELIWGALWLFRATHKRYYFDYVVNNINNLETTFTKHVLGTSYTGSSFAEFGWDDKHAAINVLFSKIAIRYPAYSLPFVPNADKFVCSVMPESPTRSVSYSPGGLMFKPGGSNLQHASALSFLLLAYARYIRRANRLVYCGNVPITPLRLVHFVQSQVDYILGTNPMNMSYMVGHGKTYPQRIHHRASSLPSVDDHRARIGCKGGSQFFASDGPNLNELTGAVVGGPGIDDTYLDSRADFRQSEPTTYINAPLVGVLAYFKSHRST